MRHETVIFLIAMLGFVCQLIGIYKAISSIQRFRELFKNWFELGHRNNTTIIPNAGAMNLVCPKPSVYISGYGHPPPNATLEQLTKWADENISGITIQIAAVDEKLDKLNSEKTVEIQNEQSQRDEAVTRMREEYQHSVSKADYAAPFLFGGTFLLLVAELGKWWFNY